jgi:hypothetical protein
MAAKPRNTATPIVRMTYVQKVLLLAACSLRRREAEARRCGRIEAVCVLVATPAT